MRSRKKQALFKVPEPSDAQVHHFSARRYASLPQTYTEPALFAGQNSLQALYHVLRDVRDSGTHPLLFHATKDFVAIYDQFPKSKYHLLVLPRAAQFASIHEFDRTKRQDMAFLSRMVQFGDEVIHGALQRIEPERVFISGFHAIPSLHPVHMHVLSLDLAGRALRKKRHYNSFATPFFLESHQALAHIRAGGRFDTANDMYNAYLEQSMQCLWCGAALSGMDVCRNHIAACPERLTAV